MLYNDLRPQVFGDIIGNTGIVSALKNIAVKYRQGKKIPEAYLFSGPTGCGKTTIARILFKSLGCGENIREINTGDFRGIETVRSLRKSIPLAPLSGAKKGYIIDECHEITSVAQNAMLKMVEELPGHVYVALGTTNPEKLIAPLRKGRVSHFVVRSLTQQEIRQLLEKTYNVLGLAQNKNIIQYISKNCEGIPRNALTMLEQVIDSGKDTDIEKTLQEIKELESKKDKIAKSLFYEKKWENIASVLQTIKEVDVENCRRSILGYCSAILCNPKTNQYNQKKAGLIMENFLNPFHQNGKPGFVCSCFVAFNLTRKGY